LTDQRSSTPPHRHFVRVDRDDVIPTCRFDSSAPLWNQWSRTKRAVLYARVSTDAQQKEGTIESQVLELKRQITAAGDVLVKEYVDDGYSGTLLDRPALEELRKDVRIPLFDAVYFLDIDRYAPGGIVGLILIILLILMLMGRV
jgi:Resolvase, N terminal domain/Protein of unknown function (DUF3309)